jgi:hypothetical protein
MVVRESGIAIGEIAMDLGPQGCVPSASDNQQEGMGRQEIDPKLPRRRFDVPSIHSAA